MKLTWEQRRDPIFGTAWSLLGLRKGECAAARRHGGKYIAHAFIGGRYMSHTARTVEAAIKRLESEIDKRSIGLLGVDDVTFSRGVRNA